MQVSEFDAASGRTFSKKTGTQTDKSILENVFVNRQVSLPARLLDPVEPTRK